MLFSKEAWYYNNLADWFPGIIMNTMDNKENKTVIISTPRLAASFHYVDLRCKCYYVTSDKNHDCDEYETAGTDRIMMVNIIMQCAIPKKILTAWCFGSLVTKFGVIFLLPGFKSNSTLSKENCFKVPMKVAGPCIVVPILLLSQVPWIAKFLSCFKWY